MGFVGASALVLFQLRATGENSYPHTGYGAALRASLVSVLTLIAIKFIFTCTEEHFGNRETNDNSGG